jgi:hypothetical protein
MQVSPWGQENLDDRRISGTLCPQVLAEVADVRGDVAAFR